MKIIQNWKWLYKRMHLGWNYSRSHLIKSIWSDDFRSNNDVLSFFVKRVQMYCANACLKTSKCDSWANWVIRRKLPGFENTCATGFVCELSGIAFSLFAPRRGSVLWQFAVFKMQSNRNTWKMSPISNRLVSTACRHWPVPHRTEIHSHHTFGGCGGSPGDSPPISSSRHFPIRKFPQTFFWTPFIALPNTFFHNFLFPVVVLSNTKKGGRTKQSFDQ